MAGLVPAIHVFYFAGKKESKTWITGTSPVTTVVSSPAALFSHAELFPTVPVIRAHLSVKGAE
jgi:hypothetical protein